MVNLAAAAYIITYTMSDTELIQKLMAQQTTPANLYDLLRSHTVMRDEIKRLNQRVDGLEEIVSELKSQRFDDSLV